jgi:hypothetical protein
MASKRLKEILNATADVRRIYHEQIERGRGFEIEEFAEHRFNTLATANKSEAEIRTSILDEVQAIERDIEDILTNYKFEDHVNLNDVEHVGPKFRYRHEIRGWENEKKSNPQERRKQLVRSIIWRAAALHSEAELWDKSNDVRLRILLERRLHIVELMRYHVSRAGSRDWRLRLEDGLLPSPKWTDGHVLRLFEYPRVPAKGATGQMFRNAIEDYVKHFPPVLDAIEANTWNATIEDNGSLHFHVPAEREWLTREQNKTANSASKYWTLDPKDPDRYRWILSKNGRDNPNDAIDQLFLPTNPDDPTRTFTHENPNMGWKNWWERNHLFCDQTLHALMLKSMLLAMLNQTQDDWFTDLITQHGKKDYIQIHKPFGGDVALGSTQSDDPFFEFREKTKLEDLEIGDCIIVHNHPVYEHLTLDVWKLENAIVVDIKKMHPDVNTVWVQGHGTAVRPLVELMNYVIDLFNKHLKGAQNAVEARLRDQSMSGITELTYDGINGNIMFRPDKPFGDPNNDRDLWGINWLDETKFYHPDTGIITLPGGPVNKQFLHFFPLWRRKDGGRVMRVQADRKSLFAAFNFYNGATAVDCIKPKIIP